MSYIVNFTDKNNKTPITVFDNTSSTDTSLTFPGRNVVGYGQIIAENFLHILENFASEAPPPNPVEGQIWYDSSTGVLQVNDGAGPSGWKAASGIQKGPVEPNLEESKVGELWVDTTNQQLRIFTGAKWILVGPSESFLDGLRYGPVVEQVADVTDLPRVILVFYVADIPVIIFSKDSFTPKSEIKGFPFIRSGININNPADADVADFVGGFLPKLNGIAVASDSLVINNNNIPAGRFLRTDTTNTTDFGINIRNNVGLTIGSEATFRLSSTPTSARIYNALPGSSLDLQVNRSGIPNTVIRILDNKVGINKLSPEQTLDVEGSIASTGAILISNSADSTNLNNGSFRTAGGIAISKNAIIGTTLTVNGISRFSNIEPSITDTYDAGTPLKRWNTVRAKTLIADSIQGTLAGNIDGNANTATSLKAISSFRIDGDVSSQRVDFDGRPNESIKIFDTKLTANIILTKDEPFPNISKNNDFVLTYRPQAPGQTAGLFKQSRDVFVGDLGVPIGGILPFAGSVPPLGYLLCDGSELDQQQYPDLYAVIGAIYNGQEPLRGINTFRIPDLRGRFALGRDNMDNNLPAIPAITGGFVDPGGGNADRVPDANADLVGGNAGRSSVTLSLNNLPQHSHTLRNGNVQYSAIRVDPSIDPPATTGLGPTASAQAQYLNDSGGIRAAPGTSFSTPFGIMNPYLTINYIIRSGPPVF